VNLPYIVGLVVSEGIATLKELQTFYGYEDLYNMFEVITVNRENEYRRLEASTNGK